MTITARATLNDLFKIDGKAELVKGEIRFMSPTGRKPGYAGDEIFVALRLHIRQLRCGVAVGDNKGFVVGLPGRESFSPDAAYYVGPDTGMKFFAGAPLFAVEVRSENDYGAAAERDMAAKRADYFAAGTLVVWDVDLLSADVVKKYSAADPMTPTVSGAARSPTRTPLCQTGRCPLTICRDAVVQEPKVDLMISEACDQ